MVEPFFVRLPWLHVKAITLWFVVFYKLDPGEEELDEETRRHETIHFKQYNETWVVGFVWRYLWDFSRAWLARGCKPSEFWNAYLCIRFEQEAYDHHGDPTYLELREKHAWRYYDVHKPKFVQVK